MSSDGFDLFINRLNDIDLHLESKMNLWLESMAFEFLKQIQDTIVQMQVVDTRRLLTSFTRGDQDNVWNHLRSALEVNIGSNLEYAQWVNDGHWTAGQTSWVNGRPYFDVAWAILQEIFKSSLRVKLGEWLGG